VKADNKITHTRDVLLECFLVLFRSSTPQRDEVPQSKNYIISPLSTHFLKNWNFWWFPTLL